MHSLSSDTGAWKHLYAVKEVLIQYNSQYGNGEKEAPGNMLIKVMYEDGKTGELDSDIILDGITEYHERFVRNRTIHTISQ